MRNHWVAKHSTLATRTARIALLALAFVALLWTPPPASAAVRSKSACDRKGSTTFARSSVARISTTAQGEVVGCLYRRGVDVDLEVYDETNIFSLAGPYVAYDTSSSSSSGSSSGVYVYNLRTGRLARSRNRSISGGFVGGPTPGEVAVSLRDLTVTPRGQVVLLDDSRFYVQCPGSAFRGCEGEARREVRVLGRKGYRVLDSGSGIAPHSLRRSGSRVYWIRDGQRKSVRLR